MRGQIGFVTVIVNVALCSRYSIVHSRSFFSKFYILFCWFCFNSRKLWLTWVDESRKGLRSSWISYNYMSIILESGLTSSKKTTSNVTTSTPDFLINRRVQQQEHITVMKMVYKTMAKNISGRARNRYILYVLSFSGKTNM